MRVSSSIPCHPARIQPDSSAAEAATPPGVYWWARALSDARLRDTISDPGACYRYSARSVRSGLSWEFQAGYKPTLGKIKTRRAPRIIRFLAHGSDLTILIASDSRKLTPRN